MLTCISGSITLHLWAQLKLVCNAKAATIVTALSGTYEGEARVTKEGGGGEGSFTPPISSSFCSEREGITWEIPFTHAMVDFLLLILEVVRN